MVLEALRNNSPSSRDPGQDPITNRTEVEERTENAFFRRMSTGFLEEPYFSPDDSSISEPVRREEATPRLLIRISIRNRRETRQVHHISNNLNHERRLPLKRLAFRATSSSHKTLGKKPPNSCHL